MKYYIIQNKYIVQFKYIAILFKENYHRYKLIYDICYNTSCNDIVMYDSYRVLKVYKNKIDLINDYPQLMLV